MTLLIFLLTVGAGLTWLNFGLGLWQTALRTERPVAEPFPVLVAIAGERLSLPANMIRHPRTRNGISDLGAVARLDLVLLWPGLSGYTEARAPQFSDAGANAPVVHVTLIDKRDPVSTEERFARIYQPNLEGDDIGGPDGLIGRRLAARSGYGGETLFFEPLRHSGRQPSRTGRYVIRCSSDKAKIAPATCFYARALTDTLQLEYRFRAGLLRDWRAVDAAVLNLVTSFGIGDAAGEPLRR